jgi:hypothetical protein
MLLACMLDDIHASGVSMVLPLEREDSLPACLPGASAIMFPLSRLAVQGLHGE